MKENDVIKECVICYEAFDYVKQFPMKPRCDDKHILCSTCLLNMVKPDRYSNPLVTCPMCRDVTPISHWRPHCITMENIESATIKDYQAGLGAADSYSCSFCEKEHPFTDFQLCLTCNPGLIKFFLDTNLDNLYSNMICSACDVHHINFHDERGHFPLMVPPHLLMLKDIPQLVTIITAAFECWQTLPNGPLVGLVLLCRYFASPDNLDRKILIYMYNIHESDYFRKDCLKQKGEVNNIYKLFCYYYLIAVRNVVRYHSTELKVSDLDELRQCLGWVGYVASQWTPECVHSLWTDALPIFNGVYDLVDTFDPGHYTYPKAKLILDIIQGMLAYENCPIHEVIWNMYNKEKHIYSRFSSPQAARDVGNFLRVLVQRARVAQNMFIDSFPGLLSQEHADGNTSKLWFCYIR